MDEGGTHQARDRRAKNCTHELPKREAQPGQDPGLQQAGGSTEPAEAAAASEALGLDFYDPALSRFQETDPQQRGPEVQKHAVKGTAARGGRVTTNTWDRVSLYGAKRTTPCPPPPIAFTDTPDVNSSDAEKGWKRPQLSQRFRGDGRFFLTGAGRGGRSSRPPLTPRECTVCVLAEHAVPGSGRPSHLP